MHSSISLNMPIEFINVTPFNPLISRCQIKVCWIGEQPNRNRSIITKEVATEMANSLPGSPIVGYFATEAKDFEEHNQIIDISNGKFEIKDTTKPYGFVDLNAKVWFEKFLDDGAVEREYMVTEGWLWTGQYPECRRCIEKGNNQSMELDEETLDGTWSKDSNGEPKFFIINEAIISKLCILGENVEPCFEGANITAPTIQFSFEDGFKEQLFSMMNELKDLLKKGGTKVFTRYAVEIGDALWTALYSHVNETYGIESVCIDGEQLFAILTSEDKHYRLNFSVNETGEYEFDSEVSLIEDYASEEEPQFNPEDITAYAESLKNQDEPVQEDVDNSDNSVEDTIPTVSYSLEEIPEYVELQSRYSALEELYNSIVTERDALQAQIEPLNQFKAQIERKEKENMIASFYMLSEEDKKDVTDNIDTYSLDDIEAKLSILCVRNKVSFSLDDDDNKTDKPVNYNLDTSVEDDGSTPDWVKAALKVAQSMN